MSTLVTVGNRGESAIEVVIQSIKDGGRELLVNGTSKIEAGKSKDFLIDEDQSIRVVEPVAVVEAPVEQLDFVSSADSLGHVEPTE